MISLHSNACPRPVGQSDIAWVDEKPQVPIRQPRPGVNSRDENNTNRIDSRSACVCACSSSSGMDEFGQVAQLA